MTKSRNRRLFAVLVSGALVAAACGGDDDAADESASESSTAADEESSDDTAPPEESSDVDDTSSSDTVDDIDSEPAESSTDDTADDTAEDSSADESSAASSDDTGSDDTGSDDATSGDTSDETAEPVAGGEVTFGLTNDGTGFDTTVAVAPGTSRILSAISDPVVYIDADENWHPNLAESVTSNDEFTTWTITLRPGITFHDGEPVDAEALVANLMGFKNSPSVGYSFGVVESITAVDDLSVEVVMTEPWATFPFALASLPGTLVSPATIGNNDTFVGTGAFMLEDWTPGDGARVVKNPNYWRADEGFPYLDAINFKFLVDPTVKRQALEAGDIDGYISPSSEDIVEFRDSDEFEVAIGEGGANKYLFVLNTATPPFDDVRVRRALAHATDRQFVIDNFRNGLTVPATGPISPDSKWYVETDYPDFDPDAAQTLVDEYESEVGPIEFQVSAEPNEDVLEVIETVASFWADVGIDATINEIGQGQSATLAIQDDFQAFSWFQFGGVDPDSNYVFFKDQHPLNWSNLSNEQIEQGIVMGRQNADEATRMEGYTMFQEGLSDQVPMVWIDDLSGVEAVVEIPELNGIGESGTFVDGTEMVPMTNGSFFRWTEIWLEQ